MNDVGLFNDSFERNITDNYQHFFSAFYRCFESKSPVVSKMFAQTSETKRYEMLEDSLLILMDYSSTRVASEDLIELARYHSKLGVPADLFTLWLDALIESLRQLDPHFNDEYALAWRMVLEPGVSFMKGYQ
ncbi:globin [Teredinibacter waterburyi]|uniref:globin n=1 Tax=Teredinibacter waterburyi TaxID=1500538 RepID=UPI00165FE79C|nr:globin [Teredinibacter waterburyi]